MESRYVYLRIEDSIGHNPARNEHPHSGIARRVRLSYLESRDMAEVLKVRAEVLAAVAPSDGVDWRAAADKAFSIVQEMAGKMFPYYFVEKEEEKESEEDRYARCFRLLKELDDKDKESKKGETVHD